MSDYRNTEDDRNPKYALQGMDIELLVKAVNGEIDLTEIAKKELAQRGMDLNGEWIGFEKAKKIMKVNQ